MHRLAGCKDTEKPGNIHAVALKFRTFHMPSPTHFCGQDGELLNGINSKVVQINFRFNK
jgi:hypothetical protein